MPLDVLGADLVWFAQDGAGGVAPRCVHAQGLKVDLIVRTLQRDDPLRRSYLRKRWHSQERCYIERKASSQIALSRR